MTSKEGTSKEGTSKEGTPIESLIEELLSDAHETGKNIISEAKNMVDNTIEEQRTKAREDAKEKVTSIKNTAKEDSRISKSSKLASAEINTQMLILEKKHAMIDQVLNQVKEKLGELVKTKNYIKLLESLIIEGSLILNTPELELMMNSKDAPLPLDLETLEKTISKEAGKKIKLKKSPKSIDTLGGVKIQTKDGKMVLDRTFDGILEHNNDQIRFKIAQIMFEK